MRRAARDPRRLRAADRAQGAPEAAGEPTGGVLARRFWWWFAPLYVTASGATAAWLTPRQRIAFWTIATAVSIAGGVVSYRSHVARCREAEAVSCDGDAPPLRTWEWGWLLPLLPPVVVVLWAVVVRFWLSPGSEAVFWLGLLVLFAVLLLCLHAIRRRNADRVERPQS